MDSESSWITASEVGEYVYCARAWYLRDEGYETETRRTAQEAGLAWHVAQGEEVVSAQRSHTASIAFIFLSVLAVMLLIFYLVTR
jgi:CRISPR/Cas system-associated exonuclease Cas4 (RecB family)